MLGRGIALACSAALAVGVCGMGLAHASDAAPDAGLVVSVDATSLAGIYPGGARPVTYTVTNPATDRPVTLHDAGPSGRVEGTLAVDPAHLGCDAGWLSFAAQGSEVATYAAGASTTYTGSVSMVNATVNQDACKGATISVTVSITG